MWIQKLQPGRVSIEKRKHFNDADWVKGTRDTSESIKETSTGSRQTFLRSHLRSISQ